MSKLKYLFIIIWVPLKKSLVICRTRIPHQNDKGFMKNIKIYKKLVCLFHLLAFNGSRDGSNSEAYFEPTSHKIRQFYI